MLDYVCVINFYIIYIIIITSSPEMFLFVAPLLVYSRFYKLMQLLTTDSF